MFLDDFASNLKDAREHKGYTQAQLAEKVGVIPQCISSYECGRTMPNLLRLSYMATALNVMIDDLVPRIAYVAEIHVDENQVDIFEYLGE